MVRGLLFSALLLTWLSLGISQGASTVSPFEQARNLERDGQYENAFVEYMSIPGAEHVAAALARPRAEKFLTLLRRHREGVPSPRTKLLEGDLLLALDQKDEALACYREVVAKIAKTKAQGWEDGLMPLHYYPVEPPMRTDSDYYSDADAWRREAHPFRLGPGSHRDNWLIRRFIALEAWDDAAREFQRIWEIHRQDTQPYVVTVNLYEEGEVVDHEKRLVRPNGFSSRGLQFAIDYAYFLNRQGSVEEALAVLAEPLLLIDMDRNPDRRQVGEVIPEDSPVVYPERTSPVAGRRSWGWVSSRGMSRKEFIRLTYGEFKQAGKAGNLVTTVRKSIAAGSNRARRVLARMCLHEGQTDTALRLELAYIDTAGFDALTSAYRRGLVHEDLHMVAQAAAEYEQVLVLPYAAPVLPDEDEEAAQARMSSAIFIPAARYDSPEGQTRLLSGVIQRLERLYSALGQTDRVLELTLRQFDVNEMLLKDLGQLEHAASRFQANDATAHFTAWARERLAEADLPRARANLCWILEDHSGTIAALASIPREEDFQPYALGEWKQRFRELGDQQLHALLKALVVAHPGDVSSRLELLHLEGRFNTQEAIEPLELFLDSNVGWAFQQRQFVYDRTWIKNYFDVAYRLMRLYEKSGQTDKLVSLGLRVARGEKPFDKHDLEQYNYRKENDLPEHVNACLALTIKYADDAQLEALAGALQDTPWVGARAQAERRRAGGWQVPGDLKPFGWANVPDEVTLIAANENVLSLCRDDKHVYAGHPWGVAIYDSAGNPVTRVALGAAATSMTTLGGALWVGTPNGVYRVDSQGFAVSHLSCDQDLEFEAKLRGSDTYTPDNRVGALAAQGDILWIGTHRDIRALDTKANQLRIFSHDELGDASEHRWDRFLFDGRYVWVDTLERQTRGCLRFDPASGTWEEPAALDSRHGVHLIGLIDGTLWGHAWVNEELRDRPCIIDRETLKVTPVLIEGQLSASERRINGPFSYFGTYHGKLVFGAKHPAYIYDDEIRKLRHIGGAWERPDDPIESDIPVGLRSGLLWWRPDGAITCCDGTTHRHEVLSKPFHARTWTVLILPDGTRVLGGTHSRSPYYDNAYTEWPFGDRVYETPDGSGGLHFISPDGNLRHVSGVPRADCILGDEVFATVPDDGAVWLGTRYGLSLLDGQCRVLRNVTRCDGLCANRVTAGAALGGKLYFATGWRDSGGGLAVYDPETTLFTSLTMTDGLATDKLDSVSVEGGELKLDYDVEYMRGSRADAQRYRLYPPGHYRPATGTFTPVPEPRLMSSGERSKAIVNLRPKPESATVPYLGGLVISQQVIDGKTFICGTRGLVILSTEARPELQIAEITPRVRFDPRVALIADANKRRGFVGSPQELAKVLQDENPYYRADVLASLLDRELDAEEYIPLIASQLDDSNPRLRTAALYLLTRSDRVEEIVPLLRGRLEDPDEFIRAVAAIGLCRSGQVPDLKHLREILEGDGHYRGPRFGWMNWTPIEVDKQRLYEVVAPHASADMFALLLEYPLGADDYEPRRKIFMELGKSLRTHPEAIDSLLRAYDTEPNLRREVNFAQTVFKYAGKDLLPRLHQALTSDNRIVRSNAARACGARGEPSSVPHLIEALDLESGLSRASIVWAIGELGATEALPHLATLYVDARNDEKRRRGAGFRVAQSGAAIGAQYESIRDLDAIGAQWDELKAAARPQPINPRRHEELLEPSHILDALRKIGPAASQEFYRALAGEKESEARREAAVGLAEGSPEDIKENLPILRQLLADTDIRVQMAAAVSLLSLGQDLAQGYILQWLAAPEEWTRHRALEELHRVRVSAQLNFARKQIEAIATDPTFDDRVRQAARELIVDQ